METQIDLTEKTKTKRTYQLKYRKDKRFSFIYYRIVLKRVDKYGWCISSYDGSQFFLPREAVLKIDSVMRGLNSNG